MKAPANPFRRAAATALAAVGLLLAGCAAAQQSQQRTYAAGADPGLGPIVIGSDGSAESRAVAALYDRLLVAAGEHVRMAATPYSTSADASKAVVSGALTLAPAYESDLLRAFADQRMAGNMAATLSMALPVGVDALPPAVAQRGVVLTVAGTAAKRYELKAIADLARVPGGVYLSGSATTDPDAPSVTALTTASSRYPAHPRPRPPRYACCAAPIRPSPTMA